MFDLISLLRNSPVLACLPSSLFWMDRIFSIPGQELQGARISSLRNKYRTEFSDAALAPLESVDASL